MIRPEHGNRDPAADRADHHDARVRVLFPRLPQGGQHRLGDRELSHQIDLDLAAEHVDRYVLKRGRHRHARVIHQAAQRPGGADSLPSRPYRGRVSQVHPEHGYRVRVVAAKRFLVGVRPHGSPHVRADAYKLLDAGPADSGGRAGHHITA